MARKTLVFKHRFAWAWLLIALCWGGCQKTELPPDVKEQPVFSVQAGAVASFEAGVDENYLFTSFTQDTFNILVFKGKFASVICTSQTCPRSLQFEFRNPFEGNDVLPEEAFHEGDFEYADQTSAQGDTIYRTTFSVQDTSGFKSFFWNFNGVSFTTGAVVQQDFQDPQPVRVSLTSVSKNSVRGSLNHLVALTGSAQFPAVQIGIKPDSANNLVYAIVTGTQSADYYWLPDTAINAPQFITPFLNKFYSVTVTDQLGNTASAQVDSVIGVNKDFLIPNFNSSVQTIFTADPLQLGRIAIQWVDAQGVIWRSDRQAQLPTAQFNVTESAPYDLNEKGQKTQKMTVTFKCLLYNPQGEVLEFEGSGVIAVAY